jgi:acyl-CoA reductase-like NAD-dependent aldehyde dehydrogenase
MAEKKKTTPTTEKNFPKRSAETLPDHHDEVEGKTGNPRDTDRDPSVPQKFSGYGKSLPSNETTEYGANAPSVDLDNSDIEYDANVESSSGFTIQERTTAEFRSMSMGDTDENVTDFDESPAEITQANISSSPSDTTQKKLNVFDSSGGDHVLLFFNLIRGEEQRGASGKTFDNCNPARGNQPMGKFPESNVLDADRAVDSAFEAQPRWASLSAIQRTGIIIDLASTVAAQARQLADIVRRESGKTITEAQREIQLTIDYLRYSASDVFNPTGETYSPFEGEGVISKYRVPRGVAVIFSDWINPLLSIAAKAGAALITGNTIVLKPNELTPQSGAVFGLLANHAGLPRGTVNVIHGTTETLLEPLCSNAKVASIAFSGNRRLTQSASISCAKSSKVFQASNLGAVWAIILEDADIRQCAKDIIESRVSSAGQGYLSVSKVLVSRKVLPAFREQLAEQLETVTIGMPGSPRTMLGPLISEDARTRYDNIIEGLGQSETDSVGMSPHIPSLEGFFVQPHIFEFHQESPFLSFDGQVGPVLGTYGFDEPMEAISLANRGEASFLSVFGDSRSDLDEINLQASATMVSINAMINTLSPNITFMGNGDGGPPRRLGGQADRDFFTHQKVSCWSQ